MLHCHRNVKTNFSIGPKWASVENNIPVGLESDRFWVCAWVPPPPCCSSLSWVWSTHWHLSRSRWQGPAPPRYSPVSPAGRPARGLHNQHRKGLYSIRSKVNPFPPTNVHINEITQILIMKYWRFLLKVVRREQNRSRFLTNIILFTGYFVDYSYFAWSRSHVIRHLYPLKMQPHWTKEEKTLTSLQTPQLTIIPSTLQQVAGWLLYSV